VSNDLRIALGLAALCLGGCGQPAATTKANTTEAPARPATVRNAADAAPTELPAQIDPPPVPAERATVVSREDITVDGKPACAFTIRYPGAVDQPVTWNGDRCGSIAARFISREELGRAGQLDDLPASAREDLNRAVNQPVFSIEGEFTASIYPLNVAGVIYEVPIAD